MAALPGIPTHARSAAALRLCVAGAEAHLSTQRFTLVDALRGFAALFVVLHYTYEGSHVTGLMAHYRRGCRTC
jgi:hypothetical protein